MLRIFPALRLCCWAMAAALCALPASSALAQTAASWTFLGGSVLSPQSTVTFASESIGSPSVVYDSIRDRFVMVFESRTPSTDPDCPAGIWALGMATSPNGTTWTMTTSPLLLPVPGSGNYFSCVAAHPAAVFLGGGNGSMQVFFKAQQDTAACATTIPSWGCGEYTGVGRMRVRFDAVGAVQSISVQASPALSPAGGVAEGYPSVIKDGSTFYMAVQHYPNIELSSSASFTTFPAPTPVIELKDHLGVVPWVDDEFFNPSLMCDDSVAFPFAMFVGGRDTSFAKIRSGAMSKAISSASILWALSATPQVEWSTDDEYRHWDTQRLITGDYLLWFTERDANGDNFIRFGATNLVFNNSDVAGRICP